ncbi:thiamine diphosphate-binding protein [Rickenella mellea]|uniref:Thiamine diphosphate-binding protein n=1 Tax=Rickenella mellea TaxID=50990 RepID=A0A4Y7PIF4_9AGAM|nr:thiamine diphosphate-binding protein [Rickenella mellea]
MYTTSSVFLKTLSDSGITHAFVNWGSDHPALLEDLSRQGRENGAQSSLNIITCPNEMVALSAAQGYAQVTGRPAVVIVHVDVGTQALAGAIHNLDRCRVPVLIYAGASPFTLEGELKGSRNEWIMWLQDIPDQSAIVRQYMRFTSQIYSGKNIAQVVTRALQSANSEPKGPVYLWARREVMEEDVDGLIMKTSLSPKYWSPVDPVGLNPLAASTISQALTAAKSPLIITSYLGRNTRAVALLNKLSKALAIPVFVSCPSVVNIPLDHSHFIGLSYGAEPNEWLRTADVVLVIDSDIPWIPMRNKPLKDARIFHVDVDVLKDNIGMFHIDAELRCRADAEVALTQLLEGIRTPNLDSLSNRTAQIRQAREENANMLQRLENIVPVDGSITVPHMLSVLRKSIPSNTLVLNEAISNYALVWQHLQTVASIPGMMITSGASSLGWGLGAAIGASLGARENSLKHDLIVLIVGDGSFLFGVPSSAYWIARRYSTPFLTIVLNNGGWKSPKLSLMGVHPGGMGSTLSGQQLTVGFGPDPPDYSQIAVAAGGAWGKRVNEAADLRGTLSEAVNVVMNEKRCAVVDCVIESI